MEQTKISLTDLHNDLLLLIIINCNDLSKFVLHFVSKKFRMLTLDNKNNRDLGTGVGTSFVMYFIRECKSNYPLWGNTKNKLCDLAATEGELSILKWFRFNKYEWNADTCANAALNGHLKVLKWVHQNGCPWDEDTCANAALNGHLKVLKWVHQNGCPWNKDTCANAALNNHLRLLKYANQNGCSWNKVTCTNAAKNGHLDVLKYAHEKGCPWGVNTCSYAAKNGARLICATVLHILIRSS